MSMGLDMDIDQSTDLPDTLFDTDSVRLIWSRKNITDAVLRAPLIPILFLFLWWCILIIFDYFDIKLVQSLKIKDLRRSSPFSFAVLHIATLTLSVYILFTAMVIPILGLTIYQAMSSFYLTILLTCLMIPNLAHFLPILLPISEFLKSTLALINKLIFPGQHQESSSNPVVPVSFLEVLIADSLCSLSRVFYDIGMSLLFFMLPDLLMTSSETVVSLGHLLSVFLSTLFAAIPFMIRQCLASRSVLNDSSPQYKIITLNIAKYMSGLIPLGLASLVSLGLRLHQYMICFSLFHSFYGYVWDVLFDWGIWTLFPSYSRQTHHFPYLYLYLAVVLNAFLKFAWAFQEVSLFSISPWGVVFILEIIEILRRFIWILFRVDYEFGKKVKVVGNGGFKDVEGGVNVASNSGSDKD